MADVRRIMIYNYSYTADIRRIYHIRLTVTLTYGCHTQYGGHTPDLRPETDSKIIIILMSYIIFIAAFYMVAKISVFGRISGVYQQYESVSRISTVCQPYIRRMSAIPNLPIFILVEGNTNNSLLTVTAAAIHFQG